MATVTNLKTLQIFAGKINDSHTITLPIWATTLNTHTDMAKLSLCGYPLLCFHI